MPLSTAVGATASSVPVPVSPNDRLKSAEEPG